MCMGVWSCGFMLVHAHSCVCNVWVDECAWVCGRVDLRAFMHVCVCAMYEWMSVHGRVVVWVLLAFMHVCVCVCVFVCVCV